MQNDHNPAIVRKELKDCYVQKVYILSVPALAPSLRSDLIRQTPNYVRNDRNAAYCVLKK